MKKVRCWGRARDDAEKAAGPTGGGGVCVLGGSLPASPGRRRRCRIGAFGHPAPTRGAGAAAGADQVHQEGAAIPLPRLQERELIWGGDDTHPPSPRPPTASATGERGADFGRAGVHQAPALLPRSVPAALWMRRPSSSSTRSSSPKAVSRGPPRGSGRGPESGENTKIPILARGFHRLSPSSPRRRQHLRAFLVRRLRRRPQWSSLLPGLHPGAASVPGFSPPPRPRCRCRQSRASAALLEL